MSSLSAIRIICLTLCLTVILSGCESAKKSLGVGARQTPDEFDVVTHDPLTLPPDYHLRPPSSQEARPQSGQDEVKARALVTGRQESEKSKKDADLSTGEKNILQRAGADKADPDIRKDIQALSNERDTKDLPVAQKLLGIGSSDPSANVVDAPKESKRIQENLKQGAPVIKGDTPTLHD